jgi:hypothetical protein
LINLGLFRLARLFEKMDFKYCTVRLIKKMMKIDTRAGNEERVYIEVEKIVNRLKYMKKDDIKQ